MKLFTQGLAGLAALVSVWAPVLAAEPVANPLVFNTTTPTNDLKGSLGARVQFAQSQILPSHPREGDNQPHLTGLRKTLILVKPIKPNATSPMRVIARDKGGKVLGSVDLSQPDELPKTAYHRDGIPAQIDFTKPAAAPHIISNGGDLQKLADRKSVFLSGLLRQKSVIEIQTADGRWVRNIYFPKGRQLRGKILRVRSNAGYTSTVHYGDQSAVISRGQSLQFKHASGQWVLESDVENQRIVYATDTWSGLLPAAWIVPGLQLEILQGDLRGQLTDLKVGAPTELLIHTIDLGMLTPPRNKFDFAKDSEAHREYFQTVPVSRMIVSQYAPLFLREVVLPDGTLLIEHDPSKAGWHTGAMRQSIGKELISHGIDNANYGLNSTAGSGESSHPYVVAQLAAHNSIGKYAQGIVVHGGSGGGGIVTLDNSLHNEFSHEVGHNYGLGHYVGGFRGSIHRSADAINSTWGWDADKNRFLPNFASSRSGQDACLEDQCQSPFHGRKYGADAMAGGAPLSSFNRFTLYTPNTASIIQRFLERKAVFDANSPTGFSKWNEATGKMTPYRHNIDVTEKIVAPVKDLSETKLSALLAEYQVVTVAMADGNWSRDIKVPPASPANRGRTVSIAHRAAYNSQLFINGQTVKVSRGFKKNYMSDGKRWKEAPATQSLIERKPQAFGVPVTTLVGYYDPEGELNSYIYPALHGAYGFTYDDDQLGNNETDCHLLVETRDGPLRFRLANHRLNANVMNKFHVNIAESSQPRSVAVICEGRTLHKTEIAPTKDKLTYTVNGRQ